MGKVDLHPYLINYAPLTALVSNPSRRHGSLWVFLGLFLRSQAARYYTILILALEYCTLLSFSPHLRYHHSFSDQRVETGEEHLTYLHTHIHLHPLAQALDSSELHHPSSTL